MKTIKNILLSAMYLLTFGICATAQTTIISPTGDGGFETGTTFADNGWTVVNGGTNNWQVGTVTKNDGARGAYIGPNATTYSYDINSGRTSHLYRDVAFPAGETNIQLSFAWKCGGVAGFDRLLLYTAPTSVTPVANNPFSPSTTLTGATLIATLNGQAVTYTNYTVSLPASFAGTTQRIIFTWQNDNGLGSPPPAAVDDISLISSALPIATDIVSTSIGGNWNAGTTWVGGFVPTATSNVTIVDTATVTIDVRTATCANLNVGTGVGGTLRYITTPAGTLTVNGDVTVAAGASFNAGTGTLPNHVLNIGGTSNTTANASNLIIDGTFDLNTTAGVTTNFFGSEDGAISGTGAIADFYSITVNKGTTATGAIQDVARVITTNVPTAAASRLTITNGTFKMSSASNITPYLGNHTIAATGRLWINNSSASITAVGVGTATGDGDININGTLQVDAGTFGYGSGNDTMRVNGALIIGSSTATVNMFGGVSVSGTFTQTAGNFNVDPQAGFNFGNSAIFFIGDLATVNFSGGTLTIVDPGATPAQGSGNFAFYIAGATGAKNFNGSIIRFGDGISSAPGGANAPYFGVSIPADVILGTVAVNNPIGTSREVVLASQSSNTLNVRNFNLFAGTLNINSNTFINHGNISNNGVINVGCALPLLCTGTLQSRGNIQNNGVINVNGGNSLLSFFGSATPLSYSGTGTITAPLPNLTIDNPAGVTIDQDAPAITILNANLRRGTLTNSDKIIIGNGGTTAAATQIGFMGSTEQGGSFDESPVFNIGTGGYSVTYAQESAARTTGFEIPPTRSITTLTVNNTNGVNLNGDDLTATGAMTLTNGLVTTGANTLIHSNGGAIRTNGFVVGNLRRNYTSAGIYTYFVGDNTGTPEYSPVRADVMAGSFPSSLTVSAVDAVLPGLSPTTAASRYWNLTESGNLTAMLTFNYLEADTPNPAVNTDETDFRVWRNNNGTLENKCPSAPCVNTMANTVTTPAGQTEFSPWGIGNLLAPTAASVTIGGRVFVGNGRGLRNAFVYLTDQNGETRLAMTNPFGYYRFNDIAAGQTVIIRISSKRYQFAPQIVSVTEDIGELNFFAELLN